LVPFTYDGLPVIGEIEGISGFIMAAGHAHAMSHAPALAVQVADLLVDGNKDSLMKFADYKRFL
jgi:glycine/D-amino acid oxidase-like deaminating enzyme